MSAHTPGPFVVNGRAIEQDKLKDALVIGYVEDEQNDDHEANANLFAASADLLASCEETLKVLGDWRYYNERSDLYRAWVERLRTAIRKARGE